MEGDDPTIYSDLVTFFGDFFQESAKVFPAFQPGSKAEERNALRKDSLALSNIMFHPLFRIAKDLWLTYRMKKVDWRVQPEWKKSIAKLDAQVADGKGNGGKVSLMSRNNPAWRGKVLIEVWGPTGITDYSLSSTRQTRDAAYSYLIDVSGLAAFLAKDTKEK